MTDYEILEKGVVSSTNDSKVVNGIAIGEGDKTRGMSGKETEWPREALEDAADKLVGIPIVKDHPGTEKTDEGLTVDSQPPIESKVGTVTDAKYENGVGLLWQGEISDPDMAEKVEQGLAEVSPIVSRDIEPVEGEDGLYRATNVKAFRDLGLVSRGAAPSNSVETGVAAMGAEALASAFDESAEPDGSAAPNGEDPSDDGANGSMPQSLVDADSKTMTEENTLSDDEKAVLSAAEDVEDAAEVLGDFANREDPTVVETTDYEALNSRVDTLKDMMGERLVEDTGLKQGTVESMSFEAMAKEFETDEGDFDAEALVQNPESGEPDADESGVEALSEDADMDKAEALYNDMQKFDVDHEDSIVEALGVSDWDTAIEVLD